MPASPPCVRAPAAPGRSGKPSPAGRRTAPPATVVGAGLIDVRMSFDAKAFLRTLTEEPGVYRMIGEGEVVLYVGKAKNLKRRVSSRIPAHPAQSAHRDHGRAGGARGYHRHPLEAEALILENNSSRALGRNTTSCFGTTSLTLYRYRRRFSRRSTITAAAFRKGVRYFGPFPQLSWAVRETLHLMQKIFRLRTCEDTTFSNRSRPCLLHQIQRCTGPCVGLIDKDAYAADVQLASLFLSGRHGDVVDDLSQRMQAASDELAFEQAAVYRDQIRNLQAVLHKQFVEIAKARMWTCSPRWSGAARCASIWR